MLPTVSEVLHLDSVMRGRPHVVAGRSHLANPVRWVHSGELVDIAHFLQGGELLLTTGIALPHHPPALERYVDELVEAQASALVVELGRRYSRNVPGAMVSAARLAHLPLIVLREEVRFVSIAEEINRRIVNAQVEELTLSARLHEAFTRLTLRRAPQRDVLSEVARLAGRPAVLEDLSHRVLEVAGLGQDEATVLSGWEWASRQVRTAEQRLDARFGLYAVEVGRDEHPWGRLVLIVDGRPSDRQILVMERAAECLSLAPPDRRDPLRVSRQVQQSLMNGVMGAAHEGELLGRARSWGFELRNRKSVGLAVMQRGPSKDDTGWRLSEQLARAAEDAKISAICGSTDASSALALLFLGAGRLVEDEVRSLCRHLHRSMGAAVVVGVGPEAADLESARRSLARARDVVSAALAVPESRPYHTAQDLDLRLLILSLRRDPRVQEFVEGRLAPILANGPEGSRLLMATLNAYLRAGGNKSAAAKSAHLSRAAFYERLRLVENRLGISLSDPEHRTALHVALMAHAIVEERPEPPVPAEVG